MAAVRPSPAVRRLVLGCFAVVATAVAVNLVFGGPAGAQDAPGLGEQWAQDEDLVDRGSELFNTNCALCHGEQGRGLPVTGAEGGPSLERVGAAAVDFMLRSGRMPMRDASEPLERGPQQMSDTERRAIVAYYVELFPDGGPDIPDIQSYDEASLSEGLELFTTNCAACHGPTAQGIAVGQQAVSSPLDVASPMEIAEAVRAGPGVMPRFLDDVLTNEEIASITAWVSQLNEREQPGGLSFGRSGTVSEGAIALLVGLGLLTVVMYLLGDRARDEDEAPVGEEDHHGRG